MTSPDSTVIDCQSCVARATAACADCVVTFLCDEPTDVPVVLDSGEVRALRVLAGAGLVPRLRHRARVY